MSTPTKYLPLCTKCSTPMTSPVNAARAALQYHLCIDCAIKEPQLRHPASIHVDHDGNPTTILPTERKTLPLL